MNGKKIVRSEIRFLSTLDNGYQFLSNFYSCNLSVDGIAYRSVEHYYQSQKTQNGEIRSAIRNSRSPSDAKSSGARIDSSDHVKGWKNRRIEVMRNGLFAKFSQNPELRRMLLDTGNSVLIEASRDAFWGGDGGQNMLGNLLMELRRSFRQVN